MVKAKLGLVVRIFLAAGAVAGLGGCVGEEGGFIDPYAIGGAALEGVAPYSRSEGAGVATAITGRAVSTTGSYRANERAGAAGATNVYVGGNEIETQGERNVGNMHINKPGYMIITDLETNRRIAMDGLDDDQVIRDYGHLYTGPYTIYGYDEDGSIRFRSTVTPQKK
ncbi:hypothetical protein A3K73_07975 [Candidatus Pacearchaeota archaeon RBG_13_36_9]|nr:MAG: hypothetical protein A3K73_07975 [Candidatus Pacearchaeota archaeon RBG_13_36_9]